MFCDIGYENAMCVYYIFLLQLFDGVCGYSYLMLQAVPITVIFNFYSEMKAKDVMLQSRTKDQADLNVERQRLLDETESLVKQTDDYNTRLMQELNGRGKVLDGLNKELESLKAQTQQEIMTKDQDLQV